MARVSPSKQNQKGRKIPYENSTAYWANEISKVDDGRARIPVELKEGFYNAWKREGKSPQRVYFIWKGTNPYARKGFFQSYGNFDTMSRRARNASLDSFRAKWTARSIFSGV